VRWLADECVDAGLVSHLRASGHDVIYMAEVAPAASDALVMMRAQAERRLLLTEDKDFGDLVFRRGQSVPGIILLRIDPAKRALKKARLDAAIGRFGDDLFGRYVTVEGARFRSRPLPRVNESSSD
jgi:predicted nuclease of predicted toxin-antitoxin system